LISESKADSKSFSKYCTIMKFIFIKYFSSYETQKLQSSVYAVHAKWFIVLSWETR